jgi:hypothetical protein
MSEAALAESGLAPAVTGYHHFPSVACRSTPRPNVIAGRRSRLTRLRPGSPTFAPEPC